MGTPTVLVSGRAGNHRHRCPVNGVPAATAADAIRWLRERRAQLYMDLLMQAHAEQFYLGFVTSSDAAREQMREVFATTDTRLPPLERARLGASGSGFASHKVNGL
jgi:hypothetical protein